MARYGLPLKTRMIVIIAGMHRSGTSALAGMLHHNGIIMGEPINWKPIPRPENPKGFYENVLFRKVNDMLLGLRRYKVKSFDPDIPTEPLTSDQRFRRRMKGLIRTYSAKYPFWGWKDPRTCLTIKTWLEVLEQMKMGKNVKILNTVRPKRDIAMSMIARRNEGDLEQFMQLADIYQYRFQKSCNGYDFISINFNELIYHTRKVARDVSNYLNFDCSDISFIEPRLANKWDKEN